MQWQRHRLQHAAIPVPVFRAPAQHYSQASQRCWDSIIPTEGVVQLGCVWTHAFKAIIPSYIGDGPAYRTCIRRIIWQASLQPSHGVCQCLGEVARSSALAFTRNRMLGASMLAWPYVAARAKLTPRVRLEIAESSQGGSICGVANHIAYLLIEGMYGWLLFGLPKVAVTMKSNPCPKLLVPGHPSMQLHLFSQKMRMPYMCEGRLGGACLRVAQQVVMASL